MLFRQLAVDDFGEGRESPTAGLTGSRIANSSLDLIERLALRDKSLDLVILGHRCVELLLDRLLVNQRSVASYESVGIEGQNSADRIDPDLRIATLFNVDGREPTAVETSSKLRPGASLRIRL